MIHITISSMIKNKGLFILDKVEMEKGDSMTYIPLE
jgi:hypothetical protein